MASSQYLIPRIMAVKPVAKIPFELSLRFADGATGHVNLAELIRGKRALAKLREAPMFRRAKPADHGFGVVWPDGIEIGVSRRMLSYYEARKWMIPKTVTLALAGWEAQRTRLAA